MVECEICFTEYQEGELELHQKMCVVHLVFRCSLCGWDYMNMEGLWNHMDLHEITDGSKEVHYQEIKAKHKFQQCTLCNDQRAYSENQYWEHVQAVHDGYFLRCSECGEKFKSEELKNDHAIRNCNIKDCKPLAESGGQNANQEGTQKQELHEGIESLSPEGDETKGPSSVTETAIEVPPTIPAGETASKFECNICGITLPTHFAAYYHKRSHQQQMRRCPYCRRALQLDNYQAHMSTCGKNRFSCELCPAKFRRQSYYTDHMHRVHEDQSRKNLPMKCDICGNIFSTKHSLQTHMICKHNAEKRRCIRCEKPFPVDEYEAHFSECGKKLYPCDTCGTQFLAMRYLIQHIKLGRCRPGKVRKGKRPDVKTSEDINSVKEILGGLERSTVNSSMRSKDEPILCKHCGRTFRQRNAATMHIRWCKHNRKALQKLQKKQSETSADPVSSNLLANNDERSNQLSQSSVGNSSKRLDNVVKHMAQTHLVRVAKEDMGTQNTEEQNQTPPHPCNIGEMSSATPGKLELHTGETHSKLVHKCPQCALEFERMPLLRRHLFVCEGTTVTVMALPQNEDIELKTEIHVENTVLQESHVQDSPFSA